LMSRKANNLINNTIMKTVKRMKTMANKRISKRKNLYYKLKNIHHNSIMRGIQLLTESDEELVRAETDKEIIRFEEDLAMKKVQINTFSMMKMYNM
jgi:hypothetical protein